MSIFDGSESFVGIIEGLVSRISQSIAKILTTHFNYRCPCFVGLKDWRNFGCLSNRLFLSSVLALPEIQQVRLSAATFYIFISKWLHFLRIIYICQVNAVRR